MSNKGHLTGELVSGAISELAKQGGATTSRHVHGVAQVGSWAVQAAAAVAPVAVAKTGALTVAAGAGLVAAAPAIIGIGAGAALIYGIAKLCDNSKK